MSEYVPFGDEWKKHVMKLPKRELVEMLAKALNEKQAVQLQLLREQQSHLTQRGADLVDIGGGLQAHPAVLAMILSDDE